MNSTCNTSGISGTTGFPLRTFTETIPFSQQNGNNRAISDLLAQTHALITPELIRAFGIDKIQENYVRIADRIRQIQVGDSLEELVSDINSVLNHNLWSLGNPGEIKGYSELCELYKKLNSYFEKELASLDAQLPSFESGTLGFSQNSSSASVSRSSFKSFDPNNNNNASTSHQFEPVLEVFNGPTTGFLIPHSHTVARLFNDSYCSQTRARPALPSFRTIEEGIRIIEEILSKNILCRHDVEDINQVYRGIDLLERRIDHIVEHTSLHALQKIIDRAKKIAQDKKIAPADLISLYHLQNFSDKDLPITDYFNTICLADLTRIQKISKNSPLISPVVHQKLFLMKMCRL